MTPEEIEKLAWEYNPVPKLDPEFIRAGFIAGFNKAKEILYTEEEVMDLINKIRTELTKNNYNHYQIDYNKLIQSIKEKK